MVKCPLCGFGISRGDIRPGGFPCPKCKERLQPRQLRRKELVASILAGFLIPYLAGARGATLLVGGALLCFLIVSVYGFLQGSISPKLERDDHAATHIILPPGSSGPCG